MNVLEQTNQKVLFFTSDELKVPDGWYIQSAHSDRIGSCETPDVDEYLKSSKACTQLPMVDGISVTIRKYEQHGHRGFVNGVFVAVQ